MAVQENKQLFLSALNQSFVDDYKVYKGIVGNINEDFKKYEINYEWSYDDFCINFLDETMKKLEKVDIFKHVNSFEDFYHNFWKFNLDVVRTIIINKIVELGYNHEKMISESYLINNPQLNN